ncbi:hypothetical protein I7X12_05205 [Halosimplex litoreum]|uniref:Peptidase C45 hydrolase domain-containing protein n=1 Tax=Halosimplex litoreum TaxID=1198301 RepID=A0A7T3G155_9EURY|nr:hypothetical protein I7X12_05205 [Halosimplex litoreum]
MDEFLLTGEPASLGVQFAGQVDDSDRTLADVAPESLDPSPAVRAYVRECEPLVAEHAPGILDELDAVADEADVEREGVRAVALAADADPGCSLVGVPGEHTGTGSALFARNHDFYPSFRRYSKLYRTEPANELASVGCAHGFAGRLDGVNEAGLAVGFAGVPTGEYEPGVMWPLAVRTVLDTCETVAGAIEYLESVPQARNVNFLVADEDGDVAVVESRWGRDPVAGRRPSPRRDQPVRVGRDARPPVDRPDTRRLLAVSRRRGVGRRARGLGRSRGPAVARRRPRGGRRVETRRSRRRPSVDHLVLGGRHRRRQRVVRA